MQAEIEGWVEQRELGGRRNSPREEAALGSQRAGNMVITREERKAARLEAARWEAKQ